MLKFKAGIMEPQGAEADFQTGGYGLQLDKVLNQNNPPPKIPLFFKLKFYEEYNETFIKKAK